MIALIDSSRMSMGAIRRGSSKNRGMKNNKKSNWSIEVFIQSLNSGLLRLQGQTSHLCIRAHEIASLTGVLS